MFQKIRIFLRYTFAWILIMVSVGVIGFVLYPLLSEKYGSMALTTHRYTGGFTVKHWYPLEIERNKEIVSDKPQVQQTKNTKLDALEEIATKDIGERTNSFFKNFKEAFSTNTNKKTVNYSKDETGAYQGQ